MKRAIGLDEINYLSKRLDSSTKTSLKSLKALPHTLLRLNIQPTKFPTGVKYPFTDSDIVRLRKEGGGIAVADLTSDPASLCTWREQMEQL